METDPYIKALFGKDARHVAFNLVIQDGEKEGEGCAIFGNTVFGSRMRFGAKGTHVLLMCDAIIRPHLVIGSNHLRGCGVSGILTSDALDRPDEWLRRGKVAINNMPVPK